MTRVAVFSESAMVTVFLAAYIQHFCETTQMFIIRLVTYSVIYFVVVVISLSLLPLPRFEGEGYAIRSACLSYF